MKKRIRAISTMAALLVLTTCATAQTGYFASGVFSGKMMFNPSQAGMRGVPELHVVLKTPMDNSQSGLAREMVLTGDLPVSESAGIGLVLQNESAGLLKQTVFNFCYAYGIKLKEDFSVRFGIGAGFKNVRTVGDNSNLNTIVGDPNDPALSAYNSIPPSFYNVFSASINLKDLELQVVAPNLTAALQNKNLQTLDYVQLQGGLSYTRKVGGGRLLGEGSAVRVFGGAIKYMQSGVVGIGGVELNANGYLTCNAFYNSTGVITGGLGVIIDQSIQVGVNYSIGGLYSRAIYGGAGVAELHVGYSFRKKKN